MASSLGPVMPVRLPAAERRAQLIDVATTVFADKGYYGASMNDVAREAGVTKPVLYQHFPSKQALYLELVGEVSERLSTAVAEAAAEATDRRTMVVSAFGAYFGFVQSNQRAFRLLFGRGAPREAEYSGGTRLVEERMSETICGLLSPDLADDRTALIARAIIGMSEGVCREWIATGTTTSPDDLANQLADLLLEGLNGLA
jgi:AcrR family transcriptional regulator